MILVIRDFDKKDLAKNKDVIYKENFASNANMVWFDVKDEKILKELQEGDFVRINGQKMIDNSYPEHTSAKRIIIIK